MLVFIDRLVGCQLRTVDDGAFALTVLYPVEYTLQAILFGSVMSVEQIRHDSCLRNDFEQNNTGFLVEHTRAIRTPEGCQSIVYELLIVSRSDGERYQFGEVVLLNIGSEW